MKKIFSAIFILLSISILFVSCAAPTTPKYATYDEYLATIDPYFSSPYSSDPRHRLRETKLSLEISFHTILEESFDKIIFIDPDTNKEYSSEECKPVDIVNNVIKPKYPENTSTYFEYLHYIREVENNDIKNTVNIEINLYLKVGSLTDVVIRVLDKNGKTIDEQYLNIDALLDYWLRQEIITSDELPSDWSYDKNWSYGGYSPS